MVLAEAKDSTENILKNTAKLAHVFGGEITLFYVKKPSDVISKDNQLSALRTLNKTYVLVQKELQNLVAPISKNYGVKIQPEFTVGNVKDEVKTYIKAENPDMIVLGQSKSNPFNLMSKSVLKYLLNKFNGLVVIASSTQVLEPSQELGLGLLNNTHAALDVAWAQTLINSSRKPLKMFKATKGHEKPAATVNTSKKVIEYVFEQGDNALKSMSKYLAKSKVDVLLVDRKTADTNTKPTSYLSDVIGQVNVPILLTSRL